MHTLLPSASSLNSSASRDIFHKLLPQEIQTSYLSKISNVELVTQIEVALGRNLNINSQLTADQRLSLIKLRKAQKQAFVWDYHDMKGLNPTLCTHRIHIREDCKPIKQPQRRINPSLREIVKEELQKLLNAGFI